MKTTIRPGSEQSPSLAPGVQESWISKTPGVCGGEACVRDTRIMVWVLEEYRRAGLSDQRILEAYPGLTAIDLVAASKYARSHPEEIEAAIRENEAD